MTLRPSELLLVSTEIAATLAGRPLQKVVQPDPRTIALGFPGDWLVISIDRRHGRVHLGEKPAGTGETAPPFCMLLRKELVGLRFSAIEPVLGERAFAIELAWGALRRRLLVFLFGAGARIVLLDERGRPLGALPHGPMAEQPVELPPPRADDRPSRFGGASPSAEIVAHYEAATAHDQVQDLRSRALAEARRELDRIGRREGALRADLARIEAASEGRRHADLLLAHLREVPRGAAEVTLPDDFGDGAPLRIGLDPALSPQDNAARLYHSFRRLQRGRATVEERLARAQAERRVAEDRLAALASATEAELPALTVSRAAPATAGAKPGRTARPEGPRPPYRTFRSAGGTPIFVGRGAAKNDELTFKVARGNDLWLHTRDVPGAHVVVPLAGRPVDEQTLLDAATLALWFSPARPDERSAAATAVQADVTYALCKFVRKPRGAPPGRVSIAGGKTLRVRLEPERIRRLLESAETSG